MAKVNQNNTKKARRRRPVAPSGHGLEEVSEPSCEEVSQPSCFALYRIVGIVQVGVGYQASAVFPSQKGPSYKTVPGCNLPGRRRCRVEGSSDPRGRHRTGLAETGFHPEGWFSPDNGAVVDPQSRPTFWSQADSRKKSLA